ncbi:MAG: pyridoxamine 5-phosphate oxidase [Deinococcus sp.]|nr:pyridoxamine 5-phosphate oxidase [Deinococcus sp.]
MSEKSLADLSQKMRGIDLTVLTTTTDGGQLAARPMSNNGEVDYDGTSYYFTYDQSRTVHDIRKDDQVQLAFQGKDYFFATVQGKAELIEDRAQMQEHWSPDLDRWFKDGLDTPGIMMIKVDAKRIHYWDGEEDGEVKL